MPKRGTETVEVRRAPTRNSDGDRVPGEHIADLTGCIVWPRSTSENSDRGIVAIDGFHIWAPAPVAAMPKATDEVVVRSGTYQVEGVPGDWRKKGQKQGILFEVKRYGT